MKREKKGTQIEGGRNEGEEAKQQVFGARALRSRSKESEKAEGCCRVFFYVSAQLSCCAPRGKCCITTSEVAENYFEIQLRKKK